MERSSTYVFEQKTYSISWVWSAIPDMSIISIYWWTLLSTWQHAAIMAACLYHGSMIVSLEKTALVFLLMPDYVMFLVCILNEWACSEICSRWTCHDILQLFFLLSISEESSITATMHGKPSGSWQDGAHISSRPPPSLPNHLSKQYQLTLSWWLQN